MGIQSGAAHRPRSASHPLPTVAQANSQPDAAAAVHAAPPSAQRMADSIVAAMARPQPSGQLALASPRSLSQVAARNAEPKAPYQTWARLVPPMTTHQRIGRWALGVTYGISAALTFSAFPPVALVGFMMGASSGLGFIYGLNGYMQALESREQFETLIRSVLRNLTLWEDDLSLKDIASVRNALRDVRVYAESVNDAARSMSRRVFALLANRQANLEKPDCRNAIDAILSSKKEMVNAAPDAMNSEAKRFRELARIYADTAARNMIRTYADSLSSWSAEKALRSQVDGAIRRGDVAELDTLAQTIVSPEVSGDSHSQLNSETSVAMLKEAQTAARACREASLELEIDAFISHGDPSGMAQKREALKNLEVGPGKLGVAVKDALISKLWVAGSQAPSWDR